MRGVSQSLTCGLILSKAGLVLLAHQTERVSVYQRNGFAGNVARGLALSGFLQRYKVRANHVACQAGAKATPLDSVVVDHDDKLHGESSNAHTPKKLVIFMEPTGKEIEVFGEDGRGAKFPASDDDEEVELAAGALFKMSGLAQPELRSVTFFGLLNAVLLLYPSQAHAADLPTNAGDNSTTTLIALLVATPFVGWGVNLLAGTNNFYNLVRFSRESFIAKLMVALNELPLNSTNKRTFGLAVMGAFEDEIVMSKLQSAVQDLLKKEEFVALVLQKADAYVDPKLNDLKQHSTDEFDKTNKRLSTIEGQMIALQATMDTLIKVLGK